MADMIRLQAKARALLQRGFKALQLKATILSLYNKNNACSNFSLINITYYLLESVLTCGYFVLVCVMYSVNNVM